MYGYDNYWKIDYESDYTFNELKLELYSASYLPQSVHLIHFQKESDSTTSNFFYNTQTNDWSEIVQGFIPTIQKLGWAYIYVHQNHIMSQVYYFDRTSSYLLHSTIDYVSWVEIDMNNHEFDIKIQPRWTDWSINHDIQMQYVEVTDIPDGIGWFAY